MKLNRKHIHALDFAITTILAERDKEKDPVRLPMMGLVSNRLRQLRILLTEACIQPKLDLTGIFHEGIEDDTDLVKGIRMLTGHCEEETS